MYSVQGNRRFEAKWRLARLVFVACAWLNVHAYGAGAPTAVTLVPIAPTEASATLRAEVNPNGLPTEVEFSVYAHQGGPLLKTGTVQAGSGDSNTVVELRVSGLPAFQSCLFRAKAVNSAGLSEGRLVALPERKPSTSNAVGHIPPALAIVSIRDVTERAATMEFEVNPMGKRTALQLSLAYDVPDPLGPRYLSIATSHQVGNGNTPQRVVFNTTGLHRGMTYRVNVSAHSRDSSGDGYSSHPGEYPPPSFTTLGEPGHNPPEFPNVSLRVPIGSTQSYTRVVAAYDVDGDTMSIESVSQPLHGSVSIDFMEWIYTPDSSYAGSDQFTITVVDAKGERTSRMVQIYDAKVRPFEFDLGLNWNVTDPPRPVGRIKVNTTIDGAFSGKLSLFETEYVLKGSFDQFNEAIREFSRPGLPPLEARLALTPSPSGEMQLVVSIYAPELVASYIAQGLPVGDAQTSEGVSSRRYTAILPLSEGAPEANALQTRAAASEASSTPRGDGFLIGKISKNGRTRLTGRTGDGQVFSIGGRLQRNRQLELAARIGRQLPDYIVGTMDFARDENNTITGSIGWLSYRSPNEYYTNDFIRVVEPRGAAYRTPKRGTNPGPGNGQTANLTVSDDTGATVLNSPLPISNGGKATFSGDQRVVLKINRQSGFFRGTLESAGQPKSKFSGALVQPLKVGQGNVLMNGPVGKVVVSAPVSEM